MLAPDPFLTQVSRPKKRVCDIIVIANASTGPFYIKTIILTEEESMTVD